MRRTFGAVWPKLLSFQDFCFWGILLYCRANIIWVRKKMMKNNFLSFLKFCKKIAYAKIMHILRVKVRNHRIFEILHMNKARNYIQFAFFWGITFSCRSNISWVIKKRTKNVISMLYKNRKNWTMKSYSTCLKIWRVEFISQRNLGYEV